jgi:predicted nucleic acid-binding protein
MTLPSNTGAVVIDANVLIALCAKEPTFTLVENTLADYASKGWLFYAPHVIVAEALYVFCLKLQNGSLTTITYDEAIQNFEDQMKAILLPPYGDIALLRRAKEIRDGYGCSRSSDSIYIALAEELSKTGLAEFLTLDKDVINQVARNAPSVMVNLLP